MRPEYYQSVGNPTQFDRLPETRPEIALLPPPHPHVVAEIFGCLTMGMGAVLAVLLLYRAPGIGWLDPFDWLLAGLPLTLFVSIWLTTGEVRWLLHPALLAAVGLLAVTDHVPWVALIAMVAGVVGVWTYAFGQHATLILTAGPIPRNAARELQAELQGHLLVLSAAAAALVLITLGTGWLVLQWTCLALPAIVLLNFAPAGLRSSPVQIVCEAVDHWCTYSPPPLPGLLQNRVGLAASRCGLVTLVALLTTIVMVRWAESPLSSVIAAGTAHHAEVTRALDDADATWGAHVRYGTLTWTLTAASALLLPVLLPAALVLTVTLPVLLEAAALRDQASDPSRPESPVAVLTANLRQSPDAIERQSVYHGQVMADGSPVLVPRIVYGEHAHGLGDSGSGKTALFLCPLIEQLVAVGDCSLIVLDLKADSLELLASLQAAAEAAYRARGVRMPLKHFSNQPNKATFAFNPMTQSFWKDFDLLTRTDILCGANSLTYGPDYGMGFYSSANAAILYHALKTFPFVTTFAELAEGIGTVLTAAKKRDLHPKIREAGVHVHEVIKRLAACAPLNVGSQTGHDAEVVDEAIDLTHVFQQQQLLYFHLSATLSPSGAPEIARLVNYLLLAAATLTERRHPVFLVIDEFQRMVANNLEYMLQLARSMGVGVILANQSLQDLKKSTTNLIPAIEANCRLRQWFAVSSQDDQERLIRSSGLTVDTSHSWSESTNCRGEVSVSHGQHEQVVPRITLNDILLMNDHPFRSILRISRGAGYAQFGGLPVIVESQYHISEGEYRRRRALPWPEPFGTFIPDAHRTVVDAPPAPGPIWTEEVLNASAQEPLSDEERAEIEGLFEGFRQRENEQPRRRKGRRK
jgi:hypothetical protein